MYTLKDQQVLEDLVDTRKYPGVSRQRSRPDR